MKEKIVHEPIGDEAVYLRIQQLQKRLLQFTDSTNARRLVREFGKDIRYIASWKKWIVWEGTHWEVDGSKRHCPALGCPLRDNDGDGAGQAAF